MLLIPVSGQQEYQYNITVVVPNDGNRDQAGKLWVTLEGKVNNEPYQFEIKLTPHSTPIKAGNNYSWYVTAPYQIENIESVLLWWKQKSWQWSNPFGINELHVQQVIFEPAYLTGSVRSKQTKRFCSTQDPVVLESETKYKFFVEC